MGTWPKLLEDKDFKIRTRGRKGRGWSAKEGGRIRKEFEEGILYQIRREYKETLPPHGPSSYITNPIPLLSSFPRRHHHPLLFPCDRNLPKPSSGRRPNKQEEGAREEDQGKRLVRVNLFGFLSISSSSLCDRSLSSLSSSCGRKSSRKTRGRRSQASKGKSTTQGL